MEYFGCQKDSHFGICKAMVLKLVELEGFENFASEPEISKSMKFASHQHATIYRNKIVLPFFVMIEAEHGA